MASGEERHMQLVQDTAKDILECLQSSQGSKSSRPRAGAGSDSSMLRSLAEQRSWHDLLHHFGELSRLLKGRQGTAQHEDSETSLWTQSLLDQFVLEPREVPPNDHPAPMSLQMAGTRVVSDLLLTKLLPEMEAQRAGARAAEGAPAVTASDTAISPESMDALKTRISSYNALLDDALKEVASVRTEDEDPTDRPVDGATAGSLPTERATAEQSMPAAKKQRV